MSDIKIKFEQNGFVIAGLPIVCVEVLNNEYKWLPMYFLVDSGANVCQLTESALESLDLDVEEGEIPIYGIAGSVDSPRECTVEVRDPKTKTEFITRKFVVVPDDVFSILKQDACVTISGILGTDFFYKNDMIINYNKLCLLMEK